MMDTLRLCLSAIALLVAIRGPEAEADVAVKNFRQIFESLKVVTGISNPPADIVGYYQKNQAILPVAGKVTEVSGNMLRAFAGLTGLFCKSLIANDATLPSDQRQAHSQVDFTAAPAAMTADIRTSVINDYALMFWSRDPSSTEITTLLTAMSQAEKALPAGVPASTKSVLLGACTAAGSSIDALVIN